MNDTTAKPLDGVLVVSIEQAVAAPVCTARLGDAGARVIKVERPEGDFARGYDAYVKGEATYFVWANHGKESVCLDLKLDEDRAVLTALLGRADVFVQNLSTGAVDRLGFGPAALRARYPRLITCSISGYGEDNAYRGMRAYDMLVQAESGLSSVSGNGRVGVSVADIVTGINAHGAIVEALLLRDRTGQGSDLRLSLFDSMTDLMAVPLLQTAYSGKAPEYVGMRHPSIVPYGSFPTTGSDVVLSIQNEREWVRLCFDVLDVPDMATRPGFESNKARTENREAVEAAISAVTRGFSQQTLIDHLRRARIACGVLNSVQEVLTHPAYRTASVELPSGEAVDLPAPATQCDWHGPALGRCPALGEHSAAIRREFGSAASGFER